MIINKRRYNEETEHASGASAAPDLVDAKMDRPARRRSSQKCRRSMMVALFTALGLGTEMNRRKKQVFHFFFLVSLNNIDGTAQHCF
jgi:hypothetical protein